MQIPTAQSRPKRTPALTGWRAAGAALAGYLALTLLFTYPLIRQFTAAIPGDSFDGWQNYWNLWWVRRALLEGHTHPYFTPELFHPTGVSLLFHTLNPFNGVIALPVHLAWGLLPAYNVVVLLSFTLGGLGAYLLARQTLGAGARFLPAFTAGAIYSFAPFHFAHLLGHMQVISLEWLPFYAIYLLRVVRPFVTRPTAGQLANTAGPARRRLHDAGLAALFLVLVALCDWYYLLYCLILTAVVGAWALWRTWRRRATSPALRQAAALVAILAGVWLAAVLVLSPLLVPMVSEARRFTFMVPDPAQSRILSADLVAYVTPQEFHPLWGAWAQARAAAFTSTVSEHQVFIGFTVLALILCAVLWAGRAPGRSRGPWLWVLIAFFVLSLGPVLHIGGQTRLLPGGGEIPLPYQALAATLPFMEITRSVSRLAVMVMLAASVLAAIALQWLIGRFRFGRALALVALVLVLFEFLPAPYPLSPPDTPAWYADLAQQPGRAAVLNLPMNWDRPGYLLYQTVHGKPLTTAYISRDDPRTLTERAPVLQHFRHLGPDIIALDLAAQGRQILSDLGVGWVVLDRYKMPGGEERSYTEAAAAAIFGGEPPTYADERITVHTVTPGPQSQPYLVLGEGWGPLQTEPRSRTFQDAATVIIRAPEGGQTTLRVTTTAGALDAPATTDGVYDLPLAIQPGDNVITLRAAAGGEPVQVTELALLP